MDTDKSGKISKREWMRFREAELDRLDMDKTGELDVKELAIFRGDSNPPPARYIRSTWDSTVAEVEVLFQ